MLNLTLAKDFFLYHDISVDISTVIDINVKCMPLSKVFKTKHRYKKYVISVNFAISSFQYKYLFRYISMWSSTKVTLFISTCVITYTVGVTADSGSGEMHLLPEPLFSIPTDNTYIVSITGAPNGRIFMAGKDGCLYELAYQVRCLLRYLVIKILDL